MTQTIQEPICFWCRHFNVQLYNEHPSEFKCAVFPQEIPRAIVASRFDHRYAFEGDQGIRFELYRSKADLPNAIQEVLVAPEDYLAIMIRGLEESRAAGRAQPPLEVFSQNTEEDAMTMYLRLANAAIERRNRGENSLEEHQSDL